MNIRTAIVSGLILASGAAATLTGCASPSEAAGSADGETARTTVVYSAWTDGADIRSVEYTLNEPTDGAIGLSDSPGRATWSTSASVLHDRVLTVTPADGSVAHCLISAPTRNVVLAAKQGEPGAPVTCDASIAPAR